MKLYQIGGYPPGAVATYLSEWMKYVGSKLPKPWEKQKIWDWRGRCRLCGKCKNE